MRHDIKLKRVISRYGLEGYGLYNLIIESITESLSTESPLPDLREDCEDIAEFYNANTARINEIMSFMINQGLFDLDEMTGRLLCSKVYKFLDTSQTRSEKLREMIRNYKETVKSLPETNYEVSQTVTDGHDIAGTNLIELEEELEQNKNKKINNTEPEKSVSVADNTFYNQIKEIFESRQIGNRFKNYGKEGTAIKQMIKDAEGRDPENPDIFLFGMIQTFSDLRETDQFYGKQPFLPSALNASGIWDRVLTEAESKHKQQEIADSFEIPEGFKF